MEEELINDFIKNDKVSIGTIAYMIHKGFLGQNRNGAKIVPARVKTFQRADGRIEPVFTEVGNPRRELSLSCYVPFIDIKSAKQAL